MVQLSERNPRLWIGTEVEGRLKGLKTLFIACSIEQDLINQHEYIIRICRENNIHHLYFNAGKTNFNEYEYIESFLTRGFIITIETTNPEDIPCDLRNDPGLHIIWRLDEHSVNLIKDTDTIKVEGLKGVFCTSLEQMSKTDWNAYTEDKIIC